MSTESVEKRIEAYKEMKKVRNSSGFHPLGRSVLVEPFEAPSKRPSVIVIPDAVKDRQMMVEQRARVIEVGPLWVKDEPEPRCRPGDLVMIARMAGFMISENDSLDGKSYRVVNHQDIFLGVEEGV